MEHWAQQYIGRRWVSGARGPLTFDCWGLVWWIYKHHYAIELPEYPGLDAENIKLVGKLLTAGEKKEWTRILKPVDGCVVGMSQNKIFHHVGIYLDVDGGLVLHAYKGSSGVISQRPSNLRSQGWNRIEFYQYNGKGN